MQKKEKHVWERGVEKGDGMRYRGQLGTGARTVVALG